MSDILANYYDNYYKREAMRNIFKNQVIKSRISDLFNHDDISVTDNNILLINSKKFKSIINNSKLKEFKNKSNKLLFRFLSANKYEILPYSTKNKNSKDIQMEVKIPNIYNNNNKNFSGNNTPRINYNINNDLSSSKNKHHIRNINNNFDKYGIISYDFNGYDENFSSLRNELFAKTTGNDNEYDNNIDNNNFNKKCDTKRSSKTYYSLKNNNNNDNYFLIDQQQQRKTNNYNLKYNTISTNVNDNINNNNNYNNFILQESNNNSTYSPINKRKKKTLTINMKPSSTNSKTDQIADNIVNSLLNTKDLKALENYYTDSNNYNIIKDANPLDNKIATQEKIISYKEKMTPLTCIQENFIQSEENRKNFRSIDTQMKVFGDERYRNILFNGVNTYYEKQSNLKNIIADTIGHNQKRGPIIRKIKVSSQDKNKNKDKYNQRGVLNVRIKKKFREFRFDTNFDKFKQKINERNQEIPEIKSKLGKTEENGKHIPKKDEEILERAKYIDIEKRMDLLINDIKKIGKNKNFRRNYFEKLLKGPIEYGVQKNINKNKNKINDDNSNDSKRKSKSFDEQDKESSVS